MRCCAAEGTDLTVIGVREVKPLPRELINELGDTAAGIAVVEEHNVHGGLSDAVSELLDRFGLPHRIERIGVPDCFGESGPPHALLEHFGLAGDTPRFAPEAVASPPVGGFWSPAGADRVAVSASLKSAFAVPDNRERPVTKEKKGRYPCSND